MYRLRTLIVVAVFAFAGAVYLAAMWYEDERTNLWSGRHDVETTLRWELETFRITHGSYPNSLDQIKIDWIRFDDRRKELLTPFYYENRGDTYVLWWHRSDQP
jgi:hypothetical protein